MANNYRDSLGTLKVNLQVLVTGLEEALADVEVEQGLVSSLGEVQDLEAKATQMVKDLHQSKKLAGHPNWWKFRT